MATPHSHHFAHATLCVEHGKPVLVEKAFTGNMRQAEQLIRLAREKKILVAEAIWTRYMPAGNGAWCILLINILMNKEVRMDNSDGRSD
ncbi:MAG: Gfo/Idh/MocA family oxidoreductase [Lachnospiraceae bacterium]